MKRKNRFKIPPYLKIALSFIILVFVGSFLLWLPISRKVDIAYVDLLYISASSVTTTGLTTIGSINNSLTTFGMAIILILAELGMFGVITFGIFIMNLFGYKMGVSDNVLMRESLNTNSMSSIRGILRTVILTAFIIEMVATGIFMIVFYPIYNDFLSALGMSVFSAVTSFTHLGFHVYSDVVHPLLANNVLFNLTTIIVETISGLGFVLIYQILKYGKWSKLNLTSKISLIMTGIVVIIGSLLIYVADHKNINVMQSFFIVANARNVGITIYGHDINTLSQFSRVLIVIIMFLGGSPASAAGSIKVTTIFIVVVSIFNLIRGKETNVFKRKISDESIKKAMGLTLLTIIIFVISTLVLSLIESKNNYSAEVVLFEVVSAFTTTGYSLGMSNNLTIASKLIFTALMVFGRIGPISVISIFSKDLNSNKDEINYIEEKVVIG